MILESNARVGDTWRKRWDSLRLFTPARYDALVGMPFPRDRFAFPTKDEMADYLESYAARFALPVRTGVTVTRVARDGDGFIVTTNDATLRADNVVIAMANYQKARVPAFACELDPAIVQLHSSEYRNPGQLGPGTVLIAGAGNSGAEIALEVARDGRRVVMSGRDTGHIPFDIGGLPGRHVLAPLVLRFVFHRVLTTGTPMGRKAMPGTLAKGTPLIRVKPKQLAAAGVERAGRVVGVREGLPLLEDGRTIEARSMIWCTGFEPGFSWIDLPVFGSDGRPVHVRGVATEPGLFFVGLHFLYSMSSTMIHGAARDSEYVARKLIARGRERVAARVVA